MSDQASRGRMERDILDAAYKAITSFGIDSFSMTDVARIAKISRPTLYRHFSNKNDLLIAMAQHMESIVDEGMEALIREGADLDARLYAISEYDDKGYSKPLLQTHSDYMLNYFNGPRSFSRTRALMEEAIEPFVGPAEKTAGVRVDRKMIVELIERLRVSLYVFEAATPREFGPRVIRAIVESAIARPDIWSIPPDSVQDGSDLE